jgi:hypothetical protein
MAALAIAARVGREVLRLGQDALSHELPRHIDDVGPAELSRWLGTTVTRQRRIDGTSGTTDRARLALEGADVPASVFLKVPAAKAGIRLFGYLAGLGENEVRFYRDVRPELDLEAPTLLGSAFDPRTKRFALVLDDLAAAGARFTDARSSLDPAQSGDVLSGLARLHGRFWQSRELTTRLAWIIPNRDDPLLPAVKWALGAMVPRIVRTSPELVPDAGRAIVDDYLGVVGRLDEGDHTVLHGDPHPGNCYFLDGRAGLLDWQVLRRGNPIRDVAYHVIIALDPETRRAAEHDLLDRYREELAAHGGPSLTADEVWHTYRRMAAAPYVAAAFTFGLGGLQGADIARSGLERAAAALVDLGTAEALGLVVGAGANSGPRPAKIRRWGSPRTRP